MNDFSLRTLDSLQKHSPSFNNNPLTFDQGTSEFGSIFNSMLMGGNAQASGNMGSSFELMMMPIMFALMEKLLSLQVNDQSMQQGYPIGVMNSANQFGNGWGYNTSPYFGAQSVPRGLPLQGRISQGSHGGHVAIDYATPTGTPVRATMAGKVSYAGWNTEGYGNLVILENGPYKTYYAHLSEIPVSVGQIVQPGMVIGLSGNTGNSTGPHLHYEVRLNGKQVDPQPFTAN